VGGLTLIKMRVERNNLRPAFWVPASSFYLLAVGISAAFFALVWGVLNAEGVDAPWLTAAMSAGIIFLGAVLLREVVFRRARARLLRQERSAAGRAAASDSRSLHKLTLEQNAAVLAEIQQKSDAANVLNNLAAGHREVFEVCAEYLRRNEHELKTVSPSSPRLTALLKGRSAVSDFHRYHMLKWAEIEARTLAEAAKNGRDSNERRASAQRAIGVVETALDNYPSDESLLASHALLKELEVSIDVTEWVEQAERAVFDSDHAAARKHYREALFHLGRDGIQTPERDQAAARVNLALERVADLEPRG